MKVDYFQMETAASIRRAIPPGAWAVSIDFMDAYLHIPIHPASRKYLRFSLEGTIYKFRALPFEISTALFVFYKLDGDCGGTYSISRTKHSPIFRRLACPSSFAGVPTVRPFTSLGNHYKSGSNTKSSEIRPSSISGLRVCRNEVPDSHWHCQSSRRVIKLLVLLFRVLQVQFITAREFLSMLGSLNAAADLLQLGRLHMRPLQFHLLANWKPHRDSLVQPIPISHSCRVAIKWWMNPSIYVAGIPIVIPAPDFHMFSDDSHSGWGAHLEPLGLEVQGLWDVASQDLHINNLELRAVFLALQHFQSHIYNSCVMVASNNSSVVAYLKKQGGTHSPSLCMLVWELLYWCHHRNIHIQVRHIPGKLNVLADSLSSPDRILPTEWSLDREIATQIFSLWGTPQIDLFSTRLNHLLPLFVSSVPDHRACAVDAMSLEWKNLFAYAFPPFKLVPLVLNKMRDSNSRFILIAPCWPRRSWFSVILSLIIDFPRELPVHRGLVSQHQGKVLHQNPAMLHLHAWKLSGVKSEVDTFLNLLPSVSLNPAESLRSGSTLRGGRCSRIGVCKGKLILSIPL